MRLNPLSRSRYFGKDSLGLKPLLASEVASFGGGQLFGDDVLISGPRYLDQNESKGNLTFLSSESYLEVFPDDGVGLVVITNSKLRSLIPDDVVCITTENDPKGFWSKSFELMLKNRLEVPSFRSRSAEVSKSAVISGSVFLDDYATIQEGAVIRGPVYVGKGSVIGPNSVIGGEGLEVASINGKRFVPPHLGGVWIDDNVEIQALSTVDKHLLLDFTVIGSGTKIDDHVHIGHGSSVGRDCTITACAEISGSVKIGNNVWISPNSSITNGVSVGDYALIGLGATVRHSVATNEVIVGSHSSFGFRCACGLTHRSTSKSINCLCGIPIEKKS